MKQLLLIFLITLLSSLIKAETPPNFVFIYADDLGNKAASTKCSQLKTSNRWLQPQRQALALNLTAYREKKFAKPCLGTTLMSNQSL